MTQHWIDLGIFTRAETDQFYADGREVIADVEARRFPFDGSWLDFRPDERLAHPTDRRRMGSRARVRPHAHDRPPRAGVDHPRD